MKEEEEKEKRAYQALSDREKVGAKRKNDGNLGHPFQGLRSYGCYSGSFSLLVRQKQGLVGWDRPKGSSVSSLLITFYVFIFVAGPRC